MYDRGGRSFWVHNTGPVGCLPYIMDLHRVTAAQVDKAGCANPYNEVAQFFNRHLKAAVLQLRKQLPLAAITYVDVYSVKYSLISRAKKHGKPLISLLVWSTRNEFPKGKVIFMPLDFDLGFNYAPKFSYLFN